MAISAKQYKFEDPRSDDEIEIHFYVGRNEDEDFISLEYDDMHGMSLEAASILASRIRRIKKWRETPEAAKRIQKLRKKEYPDV